MAENGNQSLKGWTNERIVEHVANLRLAGYPIRPSTCAICRAAVVRELVVVVKS